MHLSFAFKKIEDLRNLETPLLRAVPLGSTNVAGINVKLSYQPVSHKVLFL